MKGIFQPFGIRAWAVVFAALWNPGVSAQVSIDVGHLVLLADTPEQVIEFRVSNRGPTNIPVEALEINVQVADGGKHAGGSAIGPRITAVDVVTGTIFQDNNVGSNNASGLPQEQHPLLGLYSTVTGSSTVSIPSLSTTLLARVTFDTRGLASGRWPLALGATLNGSTRFINVASGGLDGAGLILPVIQDGSLRIGDLTDPVDPEPPNLTIQWNDDGGIVFESLGSSADRVELQSAPAIDSTDWTLVPFAGLEDGSGVRFILARTNMVEPMRFFRLITKPRP